MIKFTNYAITFAEVPDEISLTLSISNCGGRCRGCHSPELQRDIGLDLEEHLPGLIKQYRDQITCVCFLGDGNDREALSECIEYAHHRGFKTCLYTGRDSFQWLPYLDYLKLGHYDQARGGLSSPKTNQVMYEAHRVYDPSGRVISQFANDITYRFWPKDE